MMFIFGCILLFKWVNSIFLDPSVGCFNDDYLICVQVGITSFNYYQPFHSNNVNENASPSFTKLNLLIK